MLAQEEARQLGRQRVGTEDLLLGLIAQGTGVAARVLRSLRLSYDSVATRVRVHDYVRYAHVMVHGRRVSRRRGQ